MNTGNAISHPLPQFSGMVPVTRMPVCGWRVSGRSGELLQGFGFMTEGRELGAGEDRLGEHTWRPRAGAGKEALAKVKVRTRAFILVPRECA